MNINYWLLIINYRLLIIEYGFNDYWLWLRVWLLIIDIDYWLFQLIIGKRLMIMITEYNY